MANRLSTWPNDEGHFVLVDIDDYPRQERLFARIAETHGDVLGDPHKLWLFRTRRPRSFPSLVPEAWTSLNSIMGGVPRHVWAGLHVETATDVFELDELRRVRTKRRFVELDAELDPTALGHLCKELMTWRCSSCGLRGDEPLRDCPSKFICDRDTLEPQIHWVIDHTNTLADAGLEDHAVLRKITLSTDLLWPREEI